jgi:T5orf172 domain
MLTPGRRRARVSRSSTTSWLWLKRGRPGGERWFFGGDRAARRSGHRLTPPPKILREISAPDGEISMATMAGQRAQFTWALNQYNLSEDAEARTKFAKRMAKYIRAAPANGLTVDEVTQG